MSGKECGDPQSDDVVESTTSRPLQTVGTNWEPDPRKRKLEVGASLEVPSVSGHQGGRTAESSSPPPHPTPVQPHLGGTPPLAKESQQPRKRPPC